MIDISFPSQLVPALVQPRTGSIIRLLFLCAVGASQPSVDEKGLVRGGKSEMYKPRIECDARGVSPKRL
jgi:hypothetical protein